MRLINPSGWLIEGQACGKMYKFEPFSEKDVWNDEHALILIKTLQHRGLNHVTFADNIVDRYKGDFQAFRKDQAKEGLKRLKSWCRERWINERQAEMDVKHKAGAEADKAFIDSSRFAKDEELVQSWVDALELRAAEPVNVEVPQVSAYEAPVVKAEKVTQEWPRKRGRKPKALGGSPNNPNEGTS